MSASAYQEQIGGMLRKISETQMGNIETATAMADTIAKGGLAHMSGSGGAKGLLR